MKNIKTNLTFGITLISSILFLALGYFYFIVGITSANPDYICIKNVSRSCNINMSTCTDWDSNGRRTCYGSKTTQVAYINLRTTCEKGYGNGTNFSTSSSQVHYSKADGSHVLGIRHGTDSGAGGRKGRADYTYSTDSCSIQQTDTINPTGVTDAY